MATRSSILAWRIPMDRGAWQATVHRDREIQPVHPKGDQSWVFIGLMLRLKLQYFGHLMGRVDSLEKILM